MNNHEAVWNATAQLLKAQVSEGVWYSTFNDVVALTSTDESLRLQVPNAHVRDRIVTRYRPLVVDALDEIGESDRELIIEISDLQPATDSDLVVIESPETAAVATNTNNGKGLAVGLNPRYTFDNFVKGASNQFALAAALRVAETPARSYNPLFIYGQAGLGKTHLLQAIGWYVHAHYAHYEVRYVSTETFLNEYVDAIRTNTTAAFKRRYRDVDVLLIDEAQDFDEVWLQNLFKLCKASGRLIVLMDENQRLYSRVHGNFDGWIKIDHQISYRCPRIVTDHINEFGLTADPIVSRSVVEGLPTLLEFYDGGDIDSLIKATELVVKQLIADGHAKDEIAVLTIKGVESSDLFAI